MINYKCLEQKVIGAVKSAARLMFDRNFSVDRKSTASDIVTSRDIDVQTYLCAELKKIMPESGFLCEEADCNNLNYDDIWVIDPIDGTTNYARGIVYAPYRWRLSTAKKPSWASCITRFKKNCFRQPSAAARRSTEPPSKFQTDRSTMRSYAPLSVCIKRSSRRCVWISWRNCTSHATISADWAAAR